ncbi:SNF2-related protein [Aquibacillus sp. 3ASR75-11]|uniref:SNF2-related protein n=1 Tax=Terrihalobacillus insolitus TaxID=2950438 RepID=A0A9X3WVV4_9BACI|nr:SNF2-related protein [Terrihalobacillus insolitus]MDC3425041.1 SNF2-related protein [Terrihalobacillus insolitus]
MGKFLFKLDRELLDLNAMEMDDALSHFLKDLAKDSDESIEMVNDQGVTRKFKINWDDNTLQGRGIKGFFSPYNAEYLFINKETNGEIKVSSPSHSEQQRVRQKSISGADRLETVMNAMKGFKQNSETWFQLYQSAQAFQINAKDDQLVCLPYIREAQTFQYQLQTVKSVINHFKGRVLLGDEVGLGKTVEAGMAMLEYIMRGLVKKVLILTPPSLVQQWENEMKRKFNQDFIKADDPAFKKMGDQAWSHYNKVIASISTAKRKQHRDPIFNEHYDLVIVDEAHHLRNRNTQAWKFVNGINKKYIFLLTATPVQNHLEELYNLITLLKPGQLKTYRYFKNNFIESKDGIEVKNSDRLKSLISDVMIRNKRSNVDVQFTKRKAYTTTVDLPSAQQELYEDISSFIRNKYREDTPSISRFQLKNLQEQMGSTYTSMYHTLEKLAANEKLSIFDQKSLKKFSLRAQDIVNMENENNPKVNQLVHILRDFNDKMLVFTKYKSTQKFLASLLKERGFKVAEFHGGLKRKEKEEQITFFKEQADVLVSTEVGGEGRNLQFCNGMINYDLPWNPMAIEQRIGRIHRIGQTRDVFVYNLVAKDTIEHYILELLDRKINMFELVVGEVDAILGDIENEEDFSELMMKAWAHSNSKEEIESEMEQIGEKLFENKQKLLKQKELDDRLF